MDAANEFLNNLVGRWVLSGQMVESLIQQEAEGRWILGGSYLELYFRSTVPAPQGQKPYEAVYFMGYNPESDLYVLHLLDSFGVGLSCVTGMGKREGDSIPFVFHYADGPFTNRLTWEDALHEWWFEQTWESRGLQHQFDRKRLRKRLLASENPL
jgi:hypothetical protein